MSDNIGQNTGVYVSNVGQIIDLRWHNIIAILLITSLIFSTSTGFSLVDPFLLYSVGISELIVILLSEHTFMCDFSPGYPKKQNSPATLVLQWPKPLNVSQVSSNAVPLRGVQQEVVIKLIRVSLYAGSLCCDRQRRFALCPCGRSQFSFSLWAPLSLPSNNSPTAIGH